MSAITIHSKMLGAELRQLREAANLEPDEVCGLLGWSPSKLERIERGINVPKLADLTKALDLYTASSTKTAELKELREGARAGRRGWWDGYADVISILPVLEAAAKKIRGFETTLMPGLVQTPEYARSLIETARPDDDAEAVSKRVRARMNRQNELYHKPDPPDMHFIIDEAVLLRPVGDQDVLKDQISRLWQLAQKQTVTVQIIPLETGAHAGMEGAFTIIDFGVEAYPGVALTPGQAGDVYLEGVVDLKRLDRTWDRLANAALSPDDSARRCAELTR